MKKSKKNTKRTPRLVAQTLVVSVLMGTAIPSGGLGRVVYAAEETPEQINEDTIAVVDAAELGIGNVEEDLDEAKEALSDAVEAGEAVKTEINIGNDVISAEALNIINEVQAKENIKKAEETIEAGEQDIDKTLEDFETDIENSKEQTQGAVDEAQKAADEADKAKEALDSAKEAETSKEAKEQEKIAEEAADKAEEAADAAQEKAQNAKENYVKADAAYQEALKKAEEAKAEANAAFEDAKENAEEAAKAAADAEAKAEALKEEVESARKDAEEYFTEKEAELSKAQENLQTAKEKLDSAVKTEQTAREELKTATEAVVETGAFLVAAEAYEALSTVTVEGLELAIFVMEEAKAAADQALADAEAALKLAEGNEAQVQEAYDAALIAYNSANASLEQAKSDLKKAETEQANANELAQSAYGDKLMTLEKELIDAYTADDKTLVEQKTQELITTVIKYDQGSDVAKYESVTLFDSDNNIYEATDAEGNNVYYQYVKNEDGSISFFECAKTEESTIVTKRETVTELPSFEGMNEWEYEVIELEGGSYEVIYYDVNTDEDAVQIFDSEDAAKNSIQEGENKKIYSFEEVTESTYGAVISPGFSSIPFQFNPKYWSWTSFNEEQFYADLAKWNEYQSNINVKKASLLDKLNQEHVTVTVNGKEVQKDSFGLYYVDDNGIKIYDVYSYDVKIVETKTNYRVVKYNETTKVDYTLLDNMADDSYENVTNKVTNAANKYNEAVQTEKDANVAMQEAETKERESAQKLEEAENTLSQVQAHYDKIEQLYDSYYGNEKVNLPIVGETEIPGTSQYVKDKATLELAKLAAEENLKAAQAAVIKCREEHSEAVANLATKSAAYSKAVENLTFAALEVGTAELSVAGATIDLAAAKQVYETYLAKEQYVTDLEAKAEEARVKAETARDYVAELQGQVEVGQEVLDAARKSLNEAETELKNAEAAVAAAKISAMEAKEAYESIAEVVRELVKKERTSGATGAGSSDDGNDNGADSSSNVQTAQIPTLQNVVMIEDESTPLAQSFLTDGSYYIDVTPELVNDNLLMNVLHKYYGQNVYLLAHMGDGIGFTIDAENIVYGAGDLNLSGYMELVKDFEQGFTTMRFVPYHPTKLSYEIGLHMQVGVEYAGKTAYLFTKNLDTGLYEFQTTMEVSEMGNVMVNTKALTRTIAMIVD